MRRELSDLLRMYLRFRTEVLRRRPEDLRKFLSNLAEGLGDKASIIVFGGRGSKETLYSTEPRDLDLLIVVKDMNTEDVDNYVRKLRPRGLPVDVLIIKYEKFNPCDPLISSMLRKYLLIHDGLGIDSEIRRCVKQK